MGSPVTSILLIDDDEDVRNLLAAVLRSSGHTVDTAGDGKAGLALYKTRLHELVITDIVMPDMDGLELIRNLWQAASRPRIIAISGDSNLSVELYLPIARQLGAVRILAKPFRPDVLLQTVAEVLAMPPPPAIRRPPA
jgi:CheY-like chemotaxis protein